MRFKTICAMVLAGATQQVAMASAISYGTAGADYTENFDVLSTTTAPTSGYGWQNGAATSNNTGYNSPTGTAGIAGTYVFGSTISGATPDFNATPPGPRNFAGPDGITPSNWAPAPAYFASGNTGSRLYSFGIAGVNPVSDRALGFVSGSTANTGSNGTIPGDTYLGIVLQNTTGQTLKNFTLTYDGEKWRDGASVTSPQGMLFSYLVTSNFTGAASDIVTVPDDTAPYDANGDGNNGFGAYTRVSALDFTPAATGVGGLAPVDGNDPANRTAGITATIATDWAPDQYLILRWFDNDENGTDLGVGIDNLVFSASVPEPATTSLILATGMMLLARRRSRA